MSASPKSSEAEAARAAERLAFARDAGWGEAAVEPFPGDASTRSYFRLRKDGGETAIVMDAPSAAEAPYAPDDAGEAERARLGYNALARLAGNNVTAFAGLSQALVARGFSAPHVFEGDAARGLLLIEDLGEGVFARLVPEHAHEGALYAAAVDALAALYRSSLPEVVTYQGARWRVHPLDGAAQRVEARLFLDWYATHQAGLTPDETAAAQFDALWTDSAPVFAAHAPGLALRDYHAENLIWLPERDHHARVGLLDFQDAVFAHPAYDLVSLLEDARRDVAPGLAAALKDRFFERAGLSDREAFEAAYALAGAQRNAKILGIFVRLAKRDQKPRYLSMLGRVARHFVQDLSHPAASEIKRWCEDCAPFVFEEARR